MTDTVTIEKETFQEIRDALEKIDTLFPQTIENASGLMELAIIRGTLRAVAKINKDTSKR